MSLHAHCRLCADLKPRERLLDLQADEDKRTKTLEKLSRLSLHVKHLRSCDDVLPKTVCTACINLLDTAFNFVINVEEAQNVLSGHLLARGIKRDDIYHLPEVKFEENFDLLDVSSIAEPSSESDVCLNSIKLEMEQGENAFENDFELNVNSYQMEIRSKLSLDDVICGVIENCSKNFVNKEVVKTKNPDETENVTQNNVNNSDARNTKGTTVNKPKTSDKKTRKKPKAHKQICNERSGPKSWKEYRWKCVLCEAVCASFDELNAHSMQLHNRCNTYQCTECATKCFTLKTFTKHVGKHWQHLKRSCFKCYRQFSIAHDIQYHMKSHLKSNHACDGCLETFQNSEDLEKHILTYKREYQYRLSPDLKKLYDGLTCLPCKRNYADKYKLKEHILAIHSDKKQCACEKCGKLFFFKRGLVSHLKTHDDIRPFQCKVCNRAFRTNVRLQHHMGTHEDVKPFPCDQCGKKFRLKSFLKYHMNTHSDARPWVCKYCNKAFKSRTNLHGHVKTHTGEKRYTCPLCKTGFNESSSFNRHLRTVHNQQKSTKTVNSEKSNLTQ